ncbi:hypothetical protein VNO78_27974 [Psophocarpus tetragonolobus]|uniref:Epidermal patterning factor-like protein n=1 Tax=Psophocarpus tetragonolobus TaxID=3891 RepID=A0AAN9S1C6_PSOTE
MGWGWFLLSLGLEIVGRQKQKPARESLVTSVGSSSNECVFLADLEPFSRVFLLLLMERKISNGNSTTTTGNTIACLDASRCYKLAKADSNIQKYERRIGHSTVFEDKTKVSVEWARRFLGGPGSSPPRCTSKCGNCTPCRPVHVTVPPGTPVTAEYYPEAWRCKCGNKLSMP